MTKQRRGTAAHDLSRRERQKLATRTRLFDEGFELFRKNGYAGTRVEDITEAADVSKGTFFNYFGSKQGLLAAYRAERLDELTAELSRLEAEENRPVWRLQRFFATFADMIEREGDRYRLLTLHLLARPGALDPGPAGQRVFDFYRATLRAGATRGELRGDLDVETAVAVIANLWASTVIEWALAEDGRDLHPLFIPRLELVLEGMTPRL